MTISNQFSLHTRSNIVLVLLPDRLKAFQRHFSQLLGFRNRQQSISTLSKRLPITSKQNTKISLSSPLNRENYSIPKGVPTGRIPFSRHVSEITLRHIKHIAVRYFSIEYH